MSRADNTAEMSSGFQFGIIECRYFPRPIRHLEMMEIIYINKGQGVCFSGDGVTPFRPGDLFIFGAETPHYLRSAPHFYESNYPLRCGATTLRFSETILPSGYHTIADCRGIRRLMEVASRGVKWSSKGVGRDIITDIEAMEQRRGFDRFVNLLDILNRLGEMVECAEPIATQRNEEATHSRDKAYTSVVEYLTHNFHRNITLEELSIHTGMNRTALCRHFKRHAGHSIFETLLKLRVEYAGCQLATTNLSISDVAINSGFNNLPNFNVQFKRLVGTTPGEYRQGRLVND